VGAASAGQYYQEREYACASCAGRRHLGVPLSGQGQSAPPTAAGKAPHRDPGHQLAGPGPALHTVSPAHGQRQKCQSGRRRHCPRMKCLHVGHGQAGCRVTESIKRAECGHTSERFPTFIGRDAAPVWWNPRRRYDAERYSRPSIEAGTRRMHVRWEPTHGYQQDQPSGLPGSGSSDRAKEKT